MNMNRNEWQLLSSKTWSKNAYATREQKKALDEGSEMNIRA